MAAGKKRVIRCSKLARSGVKKELQKKKRGKNVENWEKLADPSEKKKKEKGERKMQIPAGGVPALKS